VAMDEAFHGTDRGEAGRSEVAMRMPSQAVRAGRAYRGNQQAAGYAYNLAQLARVSWHG